MSIESGVDAMSGPQAKEALKRFLEAYCVPAFGALPKKEIDLLVFDLLFDAGVVGDRVSLYDLMRDLRVSRAKARNLVYDRDVRRAQADSAVLDADLRRLLTHARFFKDHHYFILEVESPLLQAHLKEKVRELNYLTDTSFNPQLVRIPLPAVTDLAEAVIPEEEQEIIRKALIRAGAPDGSFKAVLTGALEQLGERIAKEAGGTFARAVVSQATEFLDPLFKASGGAITRVWSAIFGKKKVSGGGPGVVL